MKTEFEAKFYPVDKDNIRLILKQNGAKLIHSEELMPIVQFTNFANPQLKENNIDYIRLRNEFGITKGILELSGLICDFEQEKYREVWEFNNCEIVIDTCPGLKTYIEIEGVGEENVKDTALKIGLGWEDAIFTSTVEIYMKEHNLSRDAVFEKFKSWKF